MDKIIFVIVLAVLAAVLVAAIKKESISEFLVNLGRKWKKPTLPKSIKIEDAPGTETILLPDLELHQLTDDGTSVYKHSIRRRDMCNKEGEMIGLAISHPGADHEGLHLHGEKKKDGSYDTKDPGTYAALTVNSGAIKIGYDEYGFYGQVTNQNARVYEVTSDKQTKIVPCGGQFNIVNGTYVLIGKQWLYFATPDLPEFPGAKTIDHGSETKPATSGPDRVPTVKLDKSGVMKRRDPAVKAENTQSAPKSKSYVSFRFPSDE